MAGHVRWRHGMKGKAWCYVRFPFELLVAASCAGCSGSGDEKGGPDIFYMEMSASRTPVDNVVHKFTDWQKRENAIEHEIIDLDLGLDDILEIAGQVYDEIEYISDDEAYGWNYWQTSEEVETDGFADCEGYAVLIFRRVLDGGYPQDRIGVIAMDCTKKNGEETCHAAFAVWPDPDDMEYFLVIMQRQYAQCVPTYGANLEECWKFE